MHPYAEDNVLTKEERFRAEASILKLFKENFVPSDIDGAQIAGISAGRTEFFTETLSDYLYSKEFLDSIRTPKDRIKDITMYLEFDEKVTCFTHLHVNIMDNCSDIRKVDTLYDTDFYIPFDKRTGKALFKNVVRHNKLFKQYLPYIRKQHAEDLREARIRLLEHPFIMTDGHKLEI